MSVESGIGEQKPRLHDELTEEKAEGTNGLSQAINHLGRGESLDVVAQHTGMSLMVLQSLQASLITGMF